MNPHLMLSENFTIIPPELFDQSHVGRNYEDFQEYLHNLLEALKSNSSLEIFNESFKTIEDFMNLHNTYNESSHQVPTELVVLLSILYGSISLIAVIGNALVMWIVASSRNMHSVTNYFIANLALADIIIGLFSIPFQFQAALLQRWNLPYFMCAFCPFLQTISVNVSVFTLTAIAVDRYRAIMYPLNAHPSKFKSKIVIGCIWLFSSALAVPNAIALRVKNLPDDRGNLVPVCGVHNMDPVTMQMYMHILVCVQYFFPLVIITFAYVRIGWELWGAQTPGNANDGRDAQVLKNKKKVIKMMFIVVAIFAICWAPLQAYYIIAEIHPSITKFKYINYVWFASHWLAMSNSGCNPFIYAIYNEKFKREFRHKFRFVFRKSGTNEAQDLDRFRNQTSFRSIRLTAISRLSINNGCLNRRVSFPNSGDSPPKQDSLQTLSGKDSLRIESPDFRISNKVYSHRRPSDSSRILNPKYNAIPSIKVEDTVI